MEILKDILFIIVGIILIIYLTAILLSVPPIGPTSVLMEETSIDLTDQWEYTKFVIETITKYY